MSVVTMSSSLSFFSLISGLLIEANEGLHQALEASKDASTQFVIPKIEMDIKCFVIEDDGIKVVASNVEAKNRFGEKAESTLKIIYKLKP